MNVFIVLILSFLCISPYCDFTLKIENYVSFIPYLIYSVFLLFYSKKYEKNIKKNSIDGITLSMSRKSFFINFLCFVLLSLIYVSCRKLFPNYLTRNFVHFILYVLLIQNTVIRSPGFMLMNIYINNDSLKNVIILFINNMLKYSIIIWALQPKDLFYSETGKIISYFNFTLYLINFFYKYFISKSYFLFEKILGIKYYEGLNNKENLEG